MVSGEGTACVTGATSGIGLAFALALARKGHELLISGRDAGRLAALAERISGEYDVDVRWTAGDLAEDAGQAALTDAIAAEADLSLLVNNAGIGGIAPLADSSLADIRAMIAVNVSAVATLSLAAVPAIRRNQGAIINVASGVAFTAMAGAAVYGGTKAFVTQFSRTLAVELAPEGCTVQALVPGLTRTNLGGAEASGFFDRFPPEWVMEPADLVEASLIALDRKEPVCAPGVQDEGVIAQAIEALEALGNRVSNSRIAPRYADRLNSRHANA